MFSSTLIFIDYKFDDSIILEIDVNEEKWDAHLMQIRNEKKHSVKFENDTWSKVGKRYDVMKKECKEILKVFKEMRYYFYDV